MKNHIAIAIFVGCVLVAGAFFFGPDSAPLTAEGVTRQDAPRLLHGNPGADIVIVEFSDLACGFCAQLHPTLERLVSESNGSILWEYRHFPVLGPNSERGAIASECVAELAGQDTFFDYITLLFQNQSSYSDSYFTEVAQDFGLGGEKWQTCLNDPTIEARVTTDRATAQALGGNGTPYNVILFADGEAQVVPGALPYDQWVNILNEGRGIN